MSFRSINRHGYSSAKAPQEVQSVAKGSMRGPGSVDFVLSTLSVERGSTSFFSRSLLYVNVFGSPRFFLDREVSSLSPKREALTAQVCSAVGMQHGWTCWPNSMKRRKYGLQLREKFAYTLWLVRVPRFLLLSK